VLERRITRLEERSEAFARNASRSDLDAWMARRAQDDVIAALEERHSHSASRPVAEVDAVRLLFSAREIAPADANVLLRVHDVEEVIARKPGLKTAMIEAGRPTGDMLRSRLKVHWFNQAKTESKDDES
jgi:hypothetical protein